MSNEKLARLVREEIQRQAIAKLGSNMDDYQTTSGQVDMGRLKADSGISQETIADQIGVSYTHLAGGSTTLQGRQQGCSAGTWSKCWEKTRTPEKTLEMIMCYHYATP